jgi:hypothetical protein
VVKWQGKPKYSEKTCPTPPCPPQILYDLTRAQTRAAAVGSRRLTAWAMARRIPHLDTLLSAEVGYNTSTVALQVAESDETGTRCLPLGVASKVLVGLATLRTPKKTGCNVAESSTEGCGSESAVLPTETSTSTTMIDRWRLAEINICRNTVRRIQTSRRLSSARA